tara:strand:+ start:3191 stop:3679 length:489 start_codon:yes stop_codon:yes gene_type:complete
MAKEYSPYKMKGHALPGIKQSPAKRAGKMNFGRPDEMDARGVEGDRANAEKQLKDETLSADFNEERKRANSANKTGGMTTPAKQAKQKGLGPRTAFGGVKNPELTKTKKPFSAKVFEDFEAPKNPKVMIDGPKKQVTGVKNPGNWQPSVFDFDDTFKTKKKK